MSNRPTIVYQPALDGVRAFAVVVVLLFHAGIPGFDGGYLGVSVFFTLSGYLITSLLLREHDDSGTIDLAAFYARRLRRLLPAGLVCLVGVTAIATTTDLFDGVANLRAHLLGAVLQVANWVFLSGDGSYQELLERSSGTSSPLEHFWSLAIEEQFYWVWPPLMLFVLSRVPRRRGRVVVVGGLAVLTSMSAPVVAAVWGADAAYWSTPARISEIIIGAALATVLADRDVSARVSSLAPIALAVLLVCIVTFPAAGGPAYAGALPLVALVSAGLVLGLQGSSPLRRLLEREGIVWVGKVSYGLYLFHWPIFVLVHPDRFGWPGPLLFAVRIGLTVAVTIVSYELIEQPIRT
jgi:peptidoglycan/LPS O-acetylase OafA/YrhL